MIKPREWTVTRFDTSNVIATTLLSLVLGLSATAVAQTDYPSRPIHILVGFPGGTPPDIGARILGDKLVETLGKPIVVEAVVGASGNIAGDRVAKSEPDGHTLVLAANSAVVINPYLYLKMPYDPSFDLAPITQVFSYANVLVVNNNLPVRNVQDLVELARAQPGKLTIGHPGAGTTIHLSAELFRTMAGVDIRPIPYRSTIPLPDIMGGQIDMGFGTPLGALPLAREGKVRALAVTSLQRIAVAPDLPTMAESGFPGFDIVVWWGLMAPAKTPPEIVDKLYRETARVLALPEVRKRFGELGCDVIGNTPQEFASAIKVEGPRWAKFIDKLGLRLD
jgi:tripartite-type tricarboxylate transporter receptor subunit TctC